jgi:sugar lactone lactonase YvrE
MDTLFITTARHRLSEEQRTEQPGAGIFVFFSSLNTEP